MFRDIGKFSREWIKKNLQCTEGWENHGIEREHYINRERETKIYVLYICYCYIF